MFGIHSGCSKRIPVISLNSDETAGITLRSVDIATEPSFNFSNEQTHPVRGFNVVAYYRDYDITPDKEHLVMVFPANEGNVKNDRRQINTVLNWFNEVRERVPVP